ncbi:MAG TPA: ABC transporter substrate-binding protein [Solirubrobacterales bacterium]|nr:ABC transporter substrate-binding protein [Solirubrobacterales bacterium]
MCAALLAAAFGLGACGSSEDGGTLKVSYASFPDFLDPQLSYTAEGWTAMYDTYIPLLTLAHASGTAGSKVVPGLATSLPSISRDGRTYTLTLRKGLRYSDGTPVRASDFPATIERLFRLNSPGSPFYTDIVGAERFAKTKQGGISGIEADDKSGRIVIHLVKPRGTFTNELAMMFAAPLPAGTPAEDLTASPPPATGPYEIVDAKVGRGWSYVRNPQWAKHNAALVTEVPSGHVDAIDVKVVRNDDTRIHEVENGQVDWTQSGPPADLYASVKQKYEGSQFRVEHTVSTYYFWMNTRRPPFNDVKVRQAVNYAVNTAALERIYAGSLTASHQILPAGMPGHHHFNLYRYDLAKAKQLIREAHPTDRTITVWTNNESPNNEATAYYQSVLTRLGFDAKLKEVNADNYLSVIGNKNTPDRDTGWYDWFEDYPHPNDFFQPQLAGESILPVGNSNFSQMDWPFLNKEIAKLGEESLGPEQEEAYARLDELFMQLAPWVPYGSNTTSTFVSSDVDLDNVVYNPTYGDDLTSFELK